MVWIILTIIAAIFTGLSLSLRKKGLSFENVLDFIGAFAIVQLALSFPILFFKIDYVPSGSSFLLIFLAALAGLVVSFFLSAAMKSDDVSIVVPLLNLSPAVLVILSFFLLKEVLSLIQIVGVAIIIIGGYFLTTKNLKSWNHPFTEIKKRNLFYMVLTLFLLSFSVIMQKVVLQSMSFYSLYFWSSVIYTLIVLVMVIATGRIKHVLQTVKSHFWIFAIPGLLGNIADFVTLFVLGLPNVLVSLVVPVLRFSTLVSVFIGGQVFHEKNIIHKVVASLIMIAGIFILALC